MLGSTFVVLINGAALGNNKHTLDGCVSIARKYQSMGFKDISIKDTKNGIITKFDNEG